MIHLEKHLIKETADITHCLNRLDKLAADSILFVVDNDNRLVGSLTDGDMRRGLIKGLSTDNNIHDFIQPNPKFFRLTNFRLGDMQKWRSQFLKIIPVLDDDDQIIDLVNFRIQKSYLPIDAVIMAGGKGTRLRPLTLNTPKPMLKVGGKPIIEYNVDRLQSYGIRNLTITIKYLGEQLVEYFGDGSNRNLDIQYIRENEPLGTIGSLGLIDEFHNDYILVMNSDLLTNVDFEYMFQDLINKDADMIVATTPYKVVIPYGVIETKGDRIVDLKEKPTYTYYSNAGIYIFKREVVSMIPKGGNFFNATDLMQALYTNGKKVINYPILGYWLDIGKPNDFEKAQEDVKHIKF